MLLVIGTLAYTCYYPNSTVVLDSQTKSVHFIAWPSMVDSICETLHNKPFVP